MNERLIGQTNKQTNKQVNINKNEKETSPCCHMNSKKGAEYPG